MAPKIRAKMSRAIIDPTTASTTVDPVKLIRLNAVEMPKIAVPTLFQVKVFLPVCFVTAAVCVSRIMDFVVRIEAAIKPVLQRIAVDPLVKSKRMNWKSEYRAVGTGKSKSSICLSKRVGEYCVTG